MFVRNKLVDNTAKCPPVGGKPVDWWAFGFVMLYFTSLYILLSSVHRFTDGKS
jgi:hypothetical protein